MKRFVLACVCGLLCAGSLWAVPAFAPAVDGVKDAGWGFVPDHNTQTSMQPTEFNLDSGLYVTNDAANIYFGFWADPDPWGDGMQVNAHILIDVGNTAAGGTTDPYGTDVVYAQPYLPDYDIVMSWTTDNQSIGYTNFCTWNGSGWNYTELTTDGGGGGSFTEIAVARSAIGNPAEGSTINVSMWLRPQDPNKRCACCVLPSDNTCPTDWGDGWPACGGTFDSQFSYTIQAYGGDTDPPGIASVGQVDRGSMEIVFDEAMDLATLNNSGNYTTYGWTFTGFRSVTATRVQMYGVGFVDGGSYSVSVSSAVHDAAGNPMDPNADSAGWSCPDYTNVLFTCQDTTLTHDSLQFKGSWSAYRTYDASWSNGLTYWFYDDGTHGDVTAGDHLFSRSWYLTPGFRYEWGITNERGDWLIVGPNQAFDLTTTDTTVLYIMTIAEPELNQDVDVTFRCDMQFITDPIDAVQIAGYFNGWNGGGHVLTDTDADGVWEITIRFPTNSGKRQEFKFQRIHNGVNWESAPNRIVMIDDSAPTWDAGLMFFDNYIGAPDSLTAYPVSTGIQLNWQGGQRVWFDVFSHTSLDDIILNGTLVGSTQTESLVDTAMTGSLKKFYQVRARY